MEQSLQVRAPYAMSGTGLVYAIRDVRYWPTVCYHTLSGTDLVYAATRCPVLAWRVPLHDVRF
eukprot:1642980-Rhodomonas_salina.1